MTKVVCIVNHKGGVGKSTTAVNLATGLAKKGYQVALIDLDGQRNASEHLGIINEKHTSYDAFLGKELVFKHSCGVDVCPSSKNMDNVESEIAAKKSREKILKKSIDRIRHYFDYIIIDCPPSNGIVVTNALVASDSVLIPLEAEFLAYRGIDSIVGLVHEIQEDLNPKLKIEGVLLTMYNPQRNLTKIIQAEVEKFSELKLYDSVIRVNVALAEAPSVGQDIFSYAPLSNGAIDYAELVNEFLSHQKS